MGRWSNRSTVEECKSISTKWLKKYDYFIGFKSGGMSWSRGGEQTGSIGFSVSTSTYFDGDYIRFQYTQTDNYTDEKIELDYKVQLVWTPCHYGGRRWWFLCPLGGNVGCNRRVGVLYKRGRYFGCRHCHDLTYESCKDSHKLDRMFWEMGIPPKIGIKMFKESCR